MSAAAGGDCRVVGEVAARNVVLEPAAGVLDWCADLMAEGVLDWCAGLMAEVIAAVIVEWVTV